MQRQFFYREPGFAAPSGVVGLSAMHATLLALRREVAAVVFNDQTVTSATRRVRDAAQDAGVPVVGVTETLPAGNDYLTWQNDAVTRLAQALRESR